jgi:hypothetical protein
MNMLACCSQVAQPVPLLKAGPLSCSIAPDDLVTLTERTPMRSVSTDTCCLALSSENWLAGIEADKGVGVQ